MSKILVLSADKWKMTDDDGKPMSGVTVNAVTKHRQDSNDSRGYKPVKFTLPSEGWALLEASNLPALCDVEYEAVPIAGGKAGLTITGLTVITSLDIFASTKKSA